MRNDYILYHPKDKARVVFYSYNKLDFIYVAQEKMTMDGVWETYHTENMQVQEARMKYKTRLGQGYTKIPNGF